MTPAPAPDANTSSVPPGSSADNGSGPSSSTSTPSTTTEPSSVDKVVGTIELDVGDAEVFFGPEAETVIYALKMAVAKMAGVSHSLVEILVRRVLSRRRLSGPPRRRLQEGSVAVDYEIAVPQADEASAEAVAEAPTMASIADSLQSTNMSSVTLAVTEELAVAGITVEVNATGVVAEAAPAPIIIEPAPSSGPRVVFRTSTSGGQGLASHTSRHAVSTAAALAFAFVFRGGFHW